VMPLP